MNKELKSVQSMSGFGRADYSCESISGHVEIKSVNHRYLKIALKTPDSINAHHFEIEDQIRKFLTRGSVFLTIYMKYAADKLGHFINVDVVEEYQRVFKELGMHETMLPHMPGVVETDILRKLEPSAWDDIKLAIEQALKKIVAMRLREGKVLVGVLEEIMQNMHRYTLAIEAHLPAAKESFKVSLEERLGQYQITTELSEEMVARELILLVERSDISEELARLDSHIQQVGDSLGKGEPCGRSLEFIGQELLREVNTIGSKSHDLTIAQDVIALKVEIEKFREQVANLE